MILAQTLHTKSIMLCVIVAYALFLRDCDANDARYTPVAVHTGNSWTIMRDGNRITTYRDNPPLSGLLDISPGQIVRTPAESPYFRVVNRSLEAAFIWDRVDFRFDGSVGRTFQSDQNGEGFLGISPVGTLPSSRLPLARWHSNGLLLRPGEPVNLQLQKRRFVGQPYTGQWQWQNVPSAAGSIVLDQSTIIVGVTVIVVRQTNEPMSTNRALADLWFDGRTVDRLGQSLSSGGNLNSYITDHDQRSTWDPNRFDDPNQGRTVGALGQEIDSVWCYCGIHYRQNIQFRLVRYREIRSDEIPNYPSDIGTISATQLPYWVGAALARVNQLESVPADAPPTIPIVIIRNYGRTGVAQAWQQGIIMGETDVFSNIGSFFPQHTIAHELGHVLGFGSLLFLDGGGGPNNLMSNSAPILNNEQCAIAYRAAGTYAIR